jgi:DNA replication protein DnaC
MKHPDDMKSMGEILSEGGWKPKPLSGAQTDYDTVLAQHWERQQPKKRDWLLSMRCPVAEVDFVLAKHFEKRSALDAAIEFLTSPAAVLALFGGHRVGKTCAAIYAMSERMVIRRTQFGGPQTEYMRAHAIPEEPWLAWRYFDSSQRYVMAAEIAALTKSAWDDEGRALSKQLREVGFLVIDELGREWKAEPAKFEEVVAYRWSRNLKTVLISNLSMADFPSIYGKGIAARVNERGIVIECGESVKGTA